MRTTRLIALAVASVALSMPPASAGAQTLDKIASADKIVVSYREAAVPFSYVLGTRKAVGFSAEITEAIVDDVRKTLKRPYLPVEYIPVTGQTRIPMLVEGKYDLECGSTTNNVARGRDVAFSVNFFYTGTRVLVKKSSSIRGYADLAGKTVAVPAGSTNEKVVEKYAAARNLQLRLVAGKDYGEAFQLLASDQAAALALDDVLLFGLRANAPDPNAYEVVGEALQVEPYACMLRRNDPEFKKLVDGTIVRLMKTGEFARIYAKWFEAPIPPRGINLRMPMSDALKANLKAHSDQPEP